MIKIDNLSYSFPKKDLYNKISFTLEEGQHCAFIGASGNGKSTLIDIIMDPEKYLFDGKLEMDPNCRIGYVSQFSQLDKAKETTVFEYVAEKFINLQEQITSICAQMETSSDIDTLLEEYQEALDALEAIGGDDFESNINRKLNLADLSTHKDRIISELSGGEFKLVQVIKEMLNNPELMIMDEPDVFLDFENLNSLKNLINSHKGTILVITHNRYLLNHCFNKIIHLENMELQEFDGKYVDYNFSLLQTKIELQELSAADDEEIAKNEIRIERLRERATYNAEASNGRALKARVKIQERLEARRIKAPFVEIKKPYINLVTNNEVEETVALKVENLGISFDEVLLENANFEIKSTDKVAIIGTNGVGKTTLLKEIFKNNNASIEVDDNIKMSYLSQMQGDVINECNTILQEFYDVGFETYGEVRKYVGKYGFSSDILTQEISSLSGGEKNILQLAKVSASKANMLLMDEPTSHLDLY
ncbi:MAG: ATP-binding cassette domain-containing protein, partial [Peptostreptococcaceae bacterium]